MDPGEQAADLRLENHEIAAHRWSKEWLFQDGDDLFEHDFGVHEGYGPGAFRVHRQGVGGPDALSCAECHHRGGPNGSGDLSENAFFEGDGSDPASAFERNPPHILGLGIEERLAAEMSAALANARAGAITAARSSHSPVQIALRAKGVSFGSLTVRPDGSQDDAQLEGVDSDLVVKPFGWKGSAATLREFLTDGFQVHFGIQFSRPEAVGDGRPWDRDGDGSPNEITDGMMSAIVLYVARLEIPVISPPKDSDLLARFGHGLEVFQDTGCATCHVTSLPLRNPTLKITTGLTSNVLTEGEAPRPRFDVSNSDGTPIFLFSDLKRHAMGAALADARPTYITTIAYGLPNGPKERTKIPADVFLTRPLWDLADTAPYLHDGRAPTIDAAIELHGGEADASRAHFDALSSEDKAALRIFLLSLSRYPRIEFR